MERTTTAQMALLRRDVPQDRVSGALQRRRRRKTW